MTTTNTSAPTTLDWNQTKALARKVARKAGLTVKTRGCSSTQNVYIEGVGSTKVYRGDAIPVDKDNACFYLDFGYSTPLETVRKALEAMREAGLRVEWTGNPSHAMQLFV